MKNRQSVKIKGETLAAYQRMSEASGRTIVDLINDALLTYLRIFSAGQHAGLNTAERLMQKTFGDCHAPERISEGI